MKAGIISVPSRKEMMSELCSIIESNGVPVKVFMDTEKKGVWFNYFRMFKEMLESAERDEPILLLEDDMITIPNWKEYWEQIHNGAQNDLYVLFSRQRFLFNKENIARGYITKVQARGLYTTSTIYINQQDLPNKVMNWFDTKGRFVLDKNRQKHHDVVIQDYLIDIGKAWTILTPSLFQHRGVISTLGHKIGGSPMYIGDIKKNIDEI